MSDTRIGYKHSEAFAALKSVQERIGQNLTTNQYLQGLDALIMKSITPIVYGTAWFDTFLPKMLSWQVNNPRRKVVTDRKRDLMSPMLEFLVTSDPVRKLAIIKACRFDRIILIEGVSQFLANTQEYVSLVDGLKEVPHKQDPYSYVAAEKLRIEQEFGVASGKSLRSIIQQADLALAQSIDFRNRILEKFNRLCLMEAQKTYTQLGYVVELDDIVQVYRICAQRALDKCDSEQGVLATHILNWLKTGKSSILKQIQNNVVYNDTTSSEETVQDSNSELVGHIRQLAKLADPVGAGRIFLGIEEQLSHANRTLLHTFRSDVFNE